MAHTPLRSLADALQAPFRQPVETVSRSFRLDIEGGQVDEIDPPSELDEYWDQYKTTGIVRSNVNQFVSDVVEPGVRVEADNDTTEAYFHGEDGAPNDTPDGGFLENCAVFAGEKHKPFLPLLKTTVANRWVRGTALTELLKADPDDPTSPIQGFYTVRPETVYPQVVANKNILLTPDQTDLDGAELTRRDEAAAYIQFDDRSILGQRVGGFDSDDVPLSQNDVSKQVLDPDIGGNEGNEQGVFGESIMAAISTDVEEYNQTKRDRYRAIQTKAYGVWLAKFNEEIRDLGQNQKELIEWPEEDQDEWVDELNEINPGDIITADGEIELDKFQSEVPDLSATLDHYVDDITAPLPAPKYSVGHSGDINQFVTDKQEARYSDIIAEERQYQGRKWTDVFRLVAERHDALDPAGLEVTLQPEEETSPVLSLSDEEMDRLGTFTTALKNTYGTGNVATHLDEEQLADLVLQLPEDAVADSDVEEMPALDETDPQVQAQFGGPPDGEQQQPEEQQPVADGGEESPDG